MEFDKQQISECFSDFLDTKNIPHDLFHAFIDFVHEFVTYQCLTIIDKEAMLLSDEEDTFLSMSYSIDIYEKNTDKVVDLNEFWCNYQAEKADVFKSVLTDIVFSFK